MVFDSSTHRFDGKVLSSLDGPTVLFPSCDCKTGQDTKDVGNETYQKGFFFQIHLSVFRQPQNKDIPLQRFERLQKQTKASITVNN